MSVKQILDMKLIKLEVEKTSNNLIQLALADIQLIYSNGNKAICKLPIYKEGNKVHPHVGIVDENENKSIPLAIKFLFKQLNKTLETNHHGIITPFDKCTYSTKVGKKLDNLLQDINSYLNTKDYLLSDFNNFKSYTNIKTWDIDNLIHVDTLWHQALIAA